MGPARHCGVFSAWQCWHFLPMEQESLLAFATMWWLLFLTLTWLLLNHSSCWLGRSAKPPRRRFLHRLVLARRRTGTTKQQLMMVVLLLLLLLLLLSSTDTGLRCFKSPPPPPPPPPQGLTVIMSTNVSTVGKASLFDNHSSSSSAHSWRQKQILVKQTPKINLKK